MFYFFFVFIKQWVSQKLFNLLINIFLLRESRLWYLYFIFTYKLNILYIFNVLIKGQITQDALNFFSIIFYIQECSVVLVRYIFVLKITHCPSWKEMANFSYTPLQIYRNSYLKLHHNKILCFKKIATYVIDKKCLLQSTSFMYYVRKNRNLIVKFLYT